MKISEMTGLLGNDGKTAAGYELVRCLFRRF